MKWFKAMFTPILLRLHIIAPPRDTRHLVEAMELVDETSEMRRRIIPRIIANDDVFVRTMREARPNRD